MSTFALVYIGLSLGIPAVTFFLCTLGSRLGH
jgi:hypothetical protein